MIVSGTPYRYLTAVFIATVSVRAFFHLVTGLVWDDAFITFRYAENITAGLGFVYNAGERVLGTTTPLFTLILAALHGIGISTVAAALVIGILCSGITAILVDRLARRWGLGNFAPLAVVLYVLYPRLMSNEAGGMETGLFVMLVTGAFYLRACGRTAAAIAVAGLAAVTRPEGFYLVGLLVVVDSFRTPKAVLRGSVIALPIVAAWLVFSWGYFGSLLPNSMLGKLSYFGALERSALWVRGSFLLGLHHPLGIAQLLLASVGAYVLFWRRRVAGLESFWFLSLLGVYTVTHTFLFLWYMAPAYQFYCILAAGGVAKIAGLRPLTRWPLLLRGRVAAAGAVLAMGTADYFVVREYIRFQRHLDQTVVAVGHYLREHVAAAQIVAGEDIGYMGYLSGARFIDRDGLISPQVHEYNRRGDYLGLILGLKPEWVVATTAGITSTFIADEEFLTRYRLAASFGPDPQAEYRVFERTTP